MRAEPGIRAAACVVGLSLIALAVAARAARALNGYAQIQFQQADQWQLVPGTGGVLMSQRQGTRFWTQTYDVAHTTRPREDLSIFWQLQLIDIRYRGTSLSQQTPYGALRLTHTLVGFNASVQPVIVKTGVRDPSGVEHEFTDRRDQTLFSGYWLPLPGAHLDASWQRQRRQSGTGGLPAQTNTQRNAELTWEHGTLAAHGGYGDLELIGGTATGHSLQRNFDAGAAWQAVHSGRRSLQLSYTFNGVRTESAIIDRTWDHDANAVGSFRQSSRGMWSLYYDFRLQRILNQTDVQLTNNEGSLLYNYAVTRAVKLVAGGGLRTVRTETVNGVLRYLSAVLSADGPIGRGMRGGASYSHSTNWSPEYAAFSVNTWHGVATLDLNRRLKLDLDGTVGANGDTAVRAARWSLQSGASLQAQLLRSARLTLSTRRYQTGAGPFQANATSHTYPARADAQPSPEFQLAAEISRTGVYPHDEPRITVARANALWHVTSTMQLNGYYTRSDQSQTSSLARGLSGREIVGARLLLALGRPLTLDSGFNFSDPGTPRRSRQFDASLNWRFGGPS
jgi:hypothetical protein